MNVRIACSPRRRWGSTTLALLALSTGAGPIAAQTSGTITGTITAADGEPVPSSYVHLLPSGRSGLADAEGRFLLTAVPPGSYQLMVHVIGYRDAAVDIELARGETRTLTIALQARPVELSGVEVSVLRPDLLPIASLQEDAMREANPRDAGDVLRTLPGVDAVRRGPIGLDPVVRAMRESQVGTYLDGARMFPAGPARMDSPLSHLDPSAIQSIQVIKGPYALTWGAGNLTAIRAETQGVPPRLPGALHGRFVTGYDANLQASEVAGSLFGESDRVAYWGHGVYREGNDYEAGDGTVVPGQYTSWEGRGKLGLQLAPGSWLSFSAGYQEQGPIDYAGRLLDAEFFETVNLAARWDYDRSAGLVRTVDVSAYYNDVDHGMNNDNKPTAQPNPDRMPPFALDVKVDAGVRVAGGRAAVELVPSDALTLTLGGDAYFSNRNALRTIKRRDSGMTMFEDLMWPDADVDDAGLFAKADHSLGEAVQVSLAARMDVVRAQADTASEFFLENVSEQLDADETNFSASGTLRAVLGRNWSLSTGLGTAVRTADATERYSDRIPSARAQTSAEFVGNPALEPERSTQVDVWLDGRYAEVSLYGNVFARRVSDFITIEATDLPKRLPLSPDVVWQYVNGQADFWGFEASVQWRAWRGLTLGATGTYLEGEETDLNEPAFGVAPPQVDLAARYDGTGSGWFVEGLVHVVGDQDRVSESRNEATTKSYTTADLQAGWELYRGVLLRGGVNNLFDELYVNHLNARNPFTGQRIPEPGRVVFVRLSYAF